LTKSN
jgi:hypothetical protein